MRDEIGEGSEVPSMQITDNDHALEEMNVAVKNIVKETSDELDEQVLTS